MSIDLTEAIAAAHAALDERFYPGPTEEMVACIVEAAAPLIAAKALRDEANRLEGMAYGRTGAYADAGRHIIARIRAYADVVEAGQP